MDISTLEKRIKEETGELTASQNYAKALYNTAPEFKQVVWAWVDGNEKEYSYQGISLSDIQEKEACSYFRALLKMHILLTNPALAKGYKDWTPINKDWRR